MDKEYALEILSHVENKTLESNCHLAREAYNYLERLENRKKFQRRNNELLDRIYDCKYNKQW